MKVGSIFDCLTSCAQSIPQVFFYLLDAVPLFFATIVYAIWWPGKYFERLVLVEDPSKYELATV